MIIRKVQQTIANKDWSAFESLLKKHQRTTTYPDQVALTAGLLFFERWEKAENLSLKFVSNASGKELWNNLIYAQSRLGKYETAIASINKALKKFPSYEPLLFNAALVYSHVGDSESSIKCLRKCIALNTSNPSVFINLSSVLYDSGLFEDVIALVPFLDNFQRRFGLNPSQAWYNLGRAALKLQLFDEAIKYFERSIILGNDNTDCLLNIAECHNGSRRYDQAESIFRRLVTLHPDRFDIIVELIESLAKQARFREAREIFSVSTEKFGSETQPPIHPFKALGFEDHPARQKERSLHFCKDMNKLVREYSGAKIDSQRNLKISGGSKIHLCFYSADFREFPGMRLMIRMLELLDKKRFFVSAVSYGKPTADKMEQRIKAAVDVFYDCYRYNDVQLNQFLHSIEPDILFHRNGHTAHSRFLPLLNKPCPSIVNYLGYPGTTGCSAIDFIVGDAITIPESEEGNYTERVIRMPHCYQPNDNTRVRPQLLDRSHGSEVKLACFNQIYKVGDEELRVWAEVLSCYKNATLYLLAHGSLEQKNLFNVFDQHRINSGQIVFLPRVDYISHLARHQQIDLFLDTFNYNAHTTGSDALWMGVPVVTRCGKQFSSRVGASMLNAVKLPDLITRNTAEYKAKIIELISEKELITLREMKNHLVSNGPLLSLFDSELYTRNFEELVWSILEK